MAATVAVILVESSMTWLLVSTSPSGLITMPVPAPASPLYCIVVLMTTRPGSTLFTTCCSALPVPPPAAGLAAGAGTALLPGSAAAALALAGEAGRSSPSVTPVAAPAVRTATARCVIRALRRDGPDGR